MMMMMIIIVTIITIITQATPCQQHLRDMLRQRATPNSDDHYRSVATLVPVKNRPIQDYTHTDHHIPHN